MWARTIPPHGMLPSQEVEVEDAAREQEEYIDIKQEAGRTEGGQEGSR